jgi:lysophospholipase L1-like esterase
MNTFSAGIVSWLLLPLAVHLGLRVRKQAQRLPPPPGRAKGQVGDGAAEVRVLVIGDSSAAGVGADEMGDTLGPRIAARFHSATGKTVAWRNAGANSAVASQLRDYVVPNIEERDFTHVLIAVGTNDAKNFLTRSRFKKGFGGPALCHPHTLARSTDLLVTRYRHDPGSGAATGFGIHSRAPGSDHKCDGRPALPGTSRHRH